MTKFADWPKARIQELAKASGKPLEVICAEAFRSRPGRLGWNSTLGNYYRDGERVRELDILAVNEERLVWNTRYQMRVLVSCRGFVPDVTGPVTYSLEHKSPLVLQPSMPVAMRRKNRSSHDVDHATDLGFEAAQAALRHVTFSTTRPLVAFDMVKREETGSGDRWREDYKLQGDDRLVYGALESAVRAALHWRHTDIQSEPTGDGGYVTLNVPVVVFSTPFWDVGIDGGEASEPVLTHTAYQTSAFPGTMGIGDLRDMNVTTLITTKDRISALLELLESLYVDFRDRANALITRLGPY